jgi:transcriptional regulator with XRE-family HTH domain
VEQHSSVSKGLPYTADMITGDQVRAARKLLGWSQLTLALEAGSTAATVAGFETGEVRTLDGTISAIQRALNGAGIEFTEKGAKLRN